MPGGQNLASCRAHRPESYSHHWLWNKWLKTAKIPINTPLIVYRHNRMNGLLTPNERTNERTSCPLIRLSAYPLVRSIQIYFKSHVDRGRDWVFTVSRNV
jgi:hypothetical protein